MGEAETVIRVDNVSKTYVLSHRRERARYVALRDVLADKARGIGRRLLGRSGPAMNSTREEFWALRDVSFEVKRGEVVGIIGRNGAGKSTLLKILSRITEPTAGRIEIDGRVASLLEVGTGFHPELTGRENVYLNGSILGMTRAEIRRKFDEIVAFAEVEKFLDTPVKRYSSGMYVRLAFAVAAHLEPDILVLDEVLAVGDAEFQKKCFGKMGEVAKGGRTVLFVSHNMSAILAFCTHGLGLLAGSVAAVGPIAQVTQWYLQTSTSNEVARTYTSARITDRPSFKRIHIVTPTLTYGDILSIEFDLICSEQSVAAIEMEIHDAKGMALAYVSTAPMYNQMLNVGPDSARHQLHLGPLHLAAGDYTLYFWLIHPWTEFYDVVKTPLSFSIAHSDPGGTGFEFRQSYGRGSMTMPLSCGVKAT